MGVVEYREDEVLPEMRPHFPLALVLFLSLVGGSVAIDGQPAGHLDERLFYLYTAGISNLFEVPIQDFLLSFGTKLAGAGDALIGQSRSEGYGTLQNGLEVRHPLGFRVRGVVPDVGVSFVHYCFFPSAKFSLPGRSPLEVSHQFEFGVSVGSHSGGD